MGIVKIRQFSKYWNTIYAFENYWTIHNWRTKNNWSFWNVPTPTLKKSKEVDEELILPILVTKLTTALCRRSRCTVYFYLHIYRYFVNHWYIWANVDSSLLTISNTILSLRGVYLQILTAFPWKQVSNHHLSFSSQFFSYF